jgi:hypothetical protein
MLALNFIQFQSTERDMPKVLLSFKQVRPRSIIHVIGVVIFMGVSTCVVKGQAQYLK